MRHWLSLLALAMLSGVLLAFPLSGTASASAFNQNRIIDDGIFDSYNTMSANQIDNWLNVSFGGTSCISTSHGFSAPEPIGYNPTSGFIYGSNVSAGQIIYDAAQAYGINPRVLLSVLQKEQSLVSGSAGCGTLRYAAAAGYGCPDGGTTYSYTGINLYTVNGTTVTSVNGTCVNSALKVGFSQQLIRAAWLLKFGEQRSKGNTGWAVIKGNWDNSDDPQSCYGGPMTQGTFQRCPSGGSTYYDGYTTIDGVTVHIDDGATAALYWFTPHFAGNQNFVTIFTSWFGPVNDPSLYFAVIQGPNSPALYLQTSAGKYYLPTLDVMHDWGLDTQPVKQVTQVYLDSLPTHNWVGKLLKDDWGNMFLVDNGRIHYIRNASYLPLWNLSASDAVQSLGLVYTIPGGTWAGRFVQDEAQPNSQIWLMDRGQKLPVSSVNMLYDWRYTPDMLTTVSAAYLNSMPTGSGVTQYASDGANNYLVDSGQKLVFSSSDIQNAYYGNSSPVVYDSSTLALLPSISALPFVVNAATGQWFMLENGTRHYIPTSAMAQLWNKSSNIPPIPLTDTFLSSLPDGGNLTYIVQTTSPSAYWLIDSTKHYIANSDILQAWNGGVSPPVYSSQSLNLLARGADAAININSIGTPLVYMLDGGTRHYLMNAGAKDAWGGNNTLIVSPQLLASVPEGTFMNYLVKNSTGQAYLIMGGKAYPIDPSYYDVWGVSNYTPVVTAQALSRYPTSGSTLQGFINIGGTSYVMTGTGDKTPISTYADAYQPLPQTPVTLSLDYFNTTAPISYLVKSATPGDTRIWLVTQGKKILLSFEQAATFGYLSRGITPTALSPTILGLIPDDTRPASLLIQKGNSGIKLLSFGYSLGFPSGDVLANYASPANQVLQVSPSIYDTFALKRSASRLIMDDFGNYYWVENGQKRHIAFWSVLAHYLSSPITYLEGTTLNSFPLGQEITQ